MQPSFFESLESRVMFSGSTYKLPNNYVTPLTTINLGTGPARKGDTVQVVISDGAGYTVTETPSSIMPLKIDVPIYFSPTTHLPAAGKLTVSVVDNGVSKTLAGKLRVAAPPTVKGRPGTATLNFVEGEQVQLTNAENQLLPTITDPELQMQVKAEIDGVDQDLIQEEIQLQTAIAGGSLPTIFTANPPASPSPITLTVQQLSAVDSIVSAANKAFNIDSIIAALPTPKVVAQKLAAFNSALKNVLAVSALIVTPIPVVGEAADAVIAATGALSYLVCTFTPLVYTGVLQGLTHYNAQDWKDVEDQILDNSLGYIVGTSIDRIKDFISKRLPESGRPTAKAADYSLKDVNDSVEEGAVGKLINVLKDERNNPPAKGGEGGEPGTPLPNPGTGTPDPGTGTPNPGTGTPDPGTGTPDPGTPDPGTGTPDPGTGTPNPGTGTPDPGTGTPDPGTPDPGTGTPDPGTGTPDPDPTDPLPTDGKQVFVDTFQYSLDNPYPQSPVTGAATLTLVVSKGIPTVTVKDNEGPASDLPLSVTFAPFQLVDGQEVASTTQQLNGYTAKWVFFVKDGGAFMEGVYESNATSNSGQPTSTAVLMFEPLTIKLPPAS